MSDKRTDDHTLSMAILSTTSRLQSIYRSRDKAEQLANLQATIEGLKYIAHITDLQPDWNIEYQDHNAPKPNDITIISATAPKQVTPHQHFEIQVEIKNTGDRAMRDCIVMSEAPETGVRASIANLDKLEPGETWTAEVPAHALDSEGDFELKLQMYECNAENWRPAYQRSLIVIPIKVAHTQNAAAAQSESA